MKARSWKSHSLFATAVVTLGVVAGCQTTTPLTWKVPDGVKIAEVNGYPLAYTEKGSGPTVVLVHGAMCDYRCWGSTIQALSDDYRVAPRGTCSDFGSLKMPVLLVTGQNTSPRYKQILAEQAKCLPGSRTVVIPNAGHAMMMNPQVFNPALKEFLK